MTDEFPALRSKLSDTGVGGGASYSHLVSTGNPRTFLFNGTEHGTTWVQLELPFALKGLTGSVNVGSRCTLHISIKQRPTVVAAHNIGLPEVSGPPTDLMLVPDNWGYVNYTNLLVAFPGLRRLSPANSGDPLAHYELMLAAVARAINPVIDFYSLASSNYSIERVSSRDFVRFEAWHTLEDTGPRFNHAFVYFPYSELSFVAPEIEGDTALHEAVVAFSNAEQPYEFAYRLFAEAQRALVRGDERMAAIQAISGLEAAVFHFTKYRVALKPNDTEVQSVAKKSSQTLASTLNNLLPLLIPKNVVFPQGDFDSCNRLRVKRNLAIHEPHQFNGSGVEDDLPAVLRAINFLATNHAR